MSASPSPNERDLGGIARDVLLDFLGRAPSAGDADFEELCRRRPELESELRKLWSREQHAAHLDDERLAARAASASSESLAERLQRLAQPIARGARYREEQPIARGGMGAIYRVWDGDLDRALAMKVMLVGARPHSSGVSPKSSEPVARFLEEARVTGQLEHPGIVPVHELGIDAQGRLFFTMKLVKGRDLRSIFELAWSGAEGWSTTRAVGVLLKVCEALVYAHSKGVIHRDLKPANIMVGRYGEVYVMDWGVAQVARARAGEAAPPDVASRRGDDGDALLTSEGDVLGTPAYMSPEQARGEGARGSPRGDIYAIGAILYHLLARRAPFTDAGANVGTRALLERVIAGPPQPVLDANPQAAPELVAICNKAMARAPEQRYATMLELADELRAYLEGRVVRAHRAGALAVAAKWIARNRGLAAALAVALVLALAGAIALRSWRASRANLAMLEQLRTPPELMLEFDELWPPTPDKVPAMRRWLALAEQVAGQRERYHRELDALRLTALPYDPDTPLDRRERRPNELSLERAERLIAHYQEELERLQRDGGTTCEDEDIAKVAENVRKFTATRAQIAANPHPRRTWRFTNPTDELLHDRLAEIAPLVDEIAAPSSGASLIERVRRAADFMDQIRRKSLEEPREAWERACASIADARECPQYRGLRLAPQLGLVPLGRDPHSGLWEFAHLQSGEAPVRGRDGRLVLSEATGVVLVLVPGDCVYMGAQHDSPEAPNYDALAQASEAPVFRLTIEPFFISKYELTQAQWQRWTGTNPSSIKPAAESPYCKSTLHPVESVTWAAAMQTMHELGLTLPTEAQWERAARAGTQTPWPSGAERSALPAFANLCDLGAVEAKLIDKRLHNPLDDTDDAWPFHAPIGSFAANPFGLHDMCGNVDEWCRDGGEPMYPTDFYFGSGERKFEDFGSHTARGGNFQASAEFARSAARRQLGESYSNAQIGLRPAREIER